MKVCDCKYYCDICGLEVDELTRYYFAYHSDYELNGNYTTDSVDVCKKCEKDIKDFLKKLEDFIGKKFKFEKYGFGR